MAADWYYTSNKQQVGPVSWDALRQHATSGQLLPNDLVWCEGMAEWVKAARQEGLFPAGDIAAAEHLARRVAEKPSNRRPTARPRVDDEDDDEPEDGKPRTRRKARVKGMSPGLKIGLAIGAVVLVLLALACVVAIVVGIIFSVGGPGRAIPVIGGTQYSTNLLPGQHHDRLFNFRNGQRVTITVTTNRRPGPQPDVDLFVIRRGNLVAADTRISPDCDLTFIAPADDSYTVRVNNLGPGHASSQVIVNAN